MEEESFFKYVFNFDDTSKSEMLNLVQYSSLAIIPIVILNKCIQKYIPDADENAPSLQIIIEVLIQIFVMMIGLFFIHRIITYVPTYSKLQYPPFHVIYMVLSLLVIILGFQTKIGEKVNILTERIMMYWDGNKEGYDNENKKNKESKSKSKNSSQANSNPQLPPTTSSQIASTSSSVPIDSLPSMQTTMEPMAANDAIGGFSAWN